MADYDAIVGTGGLGAMMDLAPNKYFRGLIYEAYYSNKLIADPVLRDRSAYLDSGPPKMPIIVLSKVEELPVIPEPGISKMM